MLGRAESGEEIENPLPLPEPPKSCAELSDIMRAVDLLKSAKRPLLVVGKGAAYSRAEKVINQFVQMTNIPVTISKLHPQSLNNNFACYVPFRCSLLQWVKVSSTT